MRRLLLTLLVLASFSSSASAFTSVYCTLGDHPKPSSPLCASGWGSTPQEADRNAFQACRNLNAGSCNEITFHPLDHQCLSVESGGNVPVISGVGDDLFSARNKAAESCRPYGTTCTVVFEACDATPQSKFVIYVIQSTPLILLLLAITVGIIAFLARAPISNFIIHGNLPRTLPVYGEDILCLFKRTQRVNWYGRVVFGIVVNLAMTHQQLLDVRKYWLGRVVPFDSLRRQRQNMLAKLHLQRSSQLQIPKFKKLPWILAAALTIILPALLVLYFFVRALISFLLGFLFMPAFFRPACALPQP
jgi:hypothetical protein